MNKAIGYIIAFVSALCGVLVVTSKLDDLWLNIVLACATVYVIVTVLTIDDSSSSSSYEGFDKSIDSDSP